MSFPQSAPLHSQPDRLTQSFPFQAKPSSFLQSPTPMASIGEQVSLHSSNTTPHLPNWQMPLGQAAEPSSHILHGPSGAGQSASTLH